MKAWIQSLSAIVTVFILTSCSGGQLVEVELVSAKADIVSDKSKVGELVIKTEDERYSITPTSLYYEFTFKHTGNHIIDLDDQFSIEVKPFESLSGESFELLDKNIFEHDHGYSLVPMPFKPGEEKNASVYYHLGKYVGDSAVPVFPDDQQLEDLKEHALDAELVILYKDEEIARFDLSDYK